MSIIPEDGTYNNIPFNECRNMGNRKTLDHDEQVNMR